MSSDKYIKDAYNAIKKSDNLEILDREKNATAIRNARRMIIEFRYRKSLEDYLDVNIVANENDYIDYLLNQTEEAILELESIVDFTFFPDSINEEDTFILMTRDHYWYFKEMKTFLLEKQAELTKEPSIEYTGDERYLLDVNQIIKLYSLFKEFDIIETKVQFKEFLSRFDLNTSHPTKLIFKRGGQIRFCYMLSQTEVSEKDVLKQFGIKNYPKNKKDALESRAIDLVFKRAVDRILTPSIKTEVR